MWFLDSYVVKIIKRLQKEKLSSNNIHGLLLQLYQLKRSKQNLDSKNRNINDTKSLPEDEIAKSIKDITDIVKETKNLEIKEYDAKSLIPKLLAAKLSCPLISAQYLDILLIEEDSLKVNKQYFSKIICKIKPLFYVLKLI